MTRSFFLVGAVALASPSYGETIVWCAPKSRVIRTIALTTSGKLVPSQATTQVGGTVVAFAPSASGRGLIVLWRSPAGARLTHFDVVNARLVRPRVSPWLPAKSECLTASPGRDRALVATSDGDLWQVDPKRASVVARNVVASGAMALAADSRGAYLASSSSQLDNQFGELAVLKRRGSGMKVVQRISLDRVGARRLRLSSDGQDLAVIGAPILTWRRDWTSGKLSRRREIPLEASMFYPGDYDPTSGIAYPFSNDAVGAYRVQGRALQAIGRWTGPAGTEIGAVSGLGGGSVVMLAGDRSSFRTVRFRRGRGVASPPVPAMNAYQWCVIRD